MSHHQNLPRWFYRKLVVQLGHSFFAYLQSIMGETMLHVSTTGEFRNERKTNPVPRHSGAQSKLIDSNWAMYVMKLLFDYILSNQKAKFQSCQVKEIAVGKLDSPKFLVTRVAKGLAANESVHFQLRGHRFNMKSYSALSIVAVMALLLGVVTSQEDCTRQTCPEGPVQATFSSPNCTGAPVFRSLLPAIAPGL